VSKRPSKPVQRFEKHPLYGAIPLVERSHVGSDGQTYNWDQYDLAYSPPLPKGGVAGDVSRQVFHPALQVPKYFYIDETRTCVQCDSRFTFSGTEQKYWYETRRFVFDSIPIRCQACRRHRRTEHAMREQIARARQLVRTQPENPGAYLAVARALVEYHERTGSGRLDDAVATARKAGKLWPDSAEPALWEGLAHARAGRAKQARKCLADALERANALPARLASKARAYLQRRN
jgi:tetratricopeptide (TPR) repeat protein